MGKWLCHRELKMANKQPEKQEDSLNQEEITVSSGKAKSQKRHEEGPGF